VCAKFLLKVLQRFSRPHAQLVSAFSSQGSKERLRVRGVYAPSSEKEACGQRKRW